MARGFDIPREQLESGWEAEEDRLYKEAGLYFRTPHECVVDLQQKIWSRPYGSGEQKGQRQKICTRCRKWKYHNERCNLFIDGGDHPPPSSAEAPR